MRRGPPSSRLGRAPIIPGITLRPVREADEAFLLGLYASVRAPELEAVPWTDEQKALFVRQQFDAQSTFWRENYTDTSFDVVELHGQPIGRMYVARWAREIRVVDIALVPAHRGSGIGTALFGELFDEADRTGRPVTIHVEMFNPARRLYERLGFTYKEDKGVYLLMERPPGAANGTA
jgi:GNAT superfamily N-acetyltransferase